MQENLCPSSMTADQVDLGEESTICVALTDDNGCPLNLGEAGEDCAGAMEAPPAGTAFWFVYEGPEGVINHYHRPGCRQCPKTGWTKADWPWVSKQPVHIPCDYCDPWPGMGRKGLGPELWDNQYLAKPMYWSSEPILVGVPTVLDPRRGIISITIDGALFRGPGAHLAELRLHRLDTDRRWIFRRYLEVTPTLAYRTFGAITIPEVRMAIQDYRCENKVLEDWEFQDPEILMAIRRPVDDWNETPPNVGIHDVTNFPYRDHWLKCTVGHLLLAAAAKYRRNEMSFSGSVTIRKGDKHPLYEQIGNQYIREYREWMAAEKRQRNIDQGWASSLSPYSRMPRAPYW